MIYNITFCVDSDIEMKWIDWMKKNHIPQILATNKFLSARFSKIESIEQVDGNSYSVQFLCKDKSFLQDYFNDDLEKIQNENIYKSKLLSFSTQLQMIEEFFVNLN